MTAGKLPSKKILVVFIKAPIPGEVKTRLLPHLNSAESAELYSCFVKDVLQLAMKIPDVKVLVAYQPKNKFADLAWTDIKNPPEFFKQEGQSLGERLIHAFGIAFGRGAKHVAIIGSDSPTLPPIHIEQAFKSLNEADLVLGPALDGGYYLIGLSRPCLNLFDGVSWSTDQVFEITVKNAEKHGQTVRVLASHYDIDTIEDLQKLNQELANKPSQAPHTAKFLSHGLKSKPAFAAL